MNRNMLIGAVILLVLVVGGAYFVMSNREPVLENESMTSTTSPSPEVEAVTDSNGENMEGGGMAEEEGVKVFNLVATNFKYDQTELRVNTGDTVRINLKVDEGMHDFVIDEFDAKTSVLEEGGGETIEFVATDPGEYEYYCSVMEHRAMGMVGRLIVE